MCSCSYDVVSVNLNFVLPLIRSLLLTRPNTFEQQNLVDVLKFTLKNDNSRFSAYKLL